MELPNNFYSLSRTDRIEFHAKRVGDFMEVGKVLDNLNTGLTPDEIRKRLKQIKKQILQFENKLENYDWSNDD